MQLKFKFYRMEAPTAGGGAAGRPTARQGAAGSPPNIKTEVPPPTPAFAANNIHRGKKERRGVKEGVATAMPCQILDPNRR